MKIRNLLFITISSMSLLLMNNDVFATSLEVRTVEDINDNVSVNSEQMELLPHNNIIENSNEIKESNNKVINIKNEVYNSEGNFCEHLKRIGSGIVVVPVSFCLYMVSIMGFGISDNNKNKIHEASIKVMQPAFDNTIVSLKECITTSCGKLVDIGTNILSGTKSYVVRKIWG